MADPDVKEATKFLETIRQPYLKNGFKNQHDVKILDIGIDNYFKNIWSNKATFPLKHFGQSKGWTEFKIEKWKHNASNTRSTMVIRCTIPVVGVPFCNSTGCVKTIEIVERNPNCIVIEIDSKTTDAPYSDCFSIRETWIVVEVENASEETCIFQRLMKVDFVKYTMFKGKITERAEAELLALSIEWFN